MTREEAINIMSQMIKDEEGFLSDNTVEAHKMAVKALRAWDKFKQALDKRILKQGFDEDEWSISYNELIKMMKKCGEVE